MRPRTAVPVIGRAPAWPALVRPLLPVLAWACGAAMAQPAAPAPEPAPATTPATSPEASAARAMVEATARGGVLRLQVADPYVELHTGPGRGYPVAQVVARDEWLQFVRRHTDWYRVRTDRGVEGWVRRPQLQATLAAAGLAEPGRGGLDGPGGSGPRRGEFGAATGRFEGEPLLKAWATWRLAQTVAVEASVTQVQGLYAGTDSWSLALHLEPWGRARLAPTFGVGVGRLRNLPNASLVGAQTTQANVALFTVGLRWHFGERFLARADYTLQAAYLSSQRTAEYRAFSAGLGFDF